MLLGVFVSFLYTISVLLCSLRKLWMDIICNSLFAYIILISAFTLFLLSPDQVSHRVCLQKVVIFANHRRMVIFCLWSGLYSHTQHTYYFVWALLTRIYAFSFVFKLMCMVYIHHSLVSPKVSPNITIDKEEGRMDAMSKWLAPLYFAAHCNVHSHPFLSILFTWLRWAVGHGHGLWSWTLCEAMAG